MIKNAAEELLKIADEIDKVAADVTMFVCDKCNHTASLAKINSKRKSAKIANENVTISDITVNDAVNCPACDGVMTYNASEESEAFYFDPEKTAKEDEEDDKKEKEEDKEAAIDYDSIEVE